MPKAMMDIKWSTDSAFRPEYAKQDLSRIANSYFFIPQFNARWDSRTHPDDALKMMELVKRVSPSHSSCLRTARRYTLGKGLFVDTAKRGNAGRTKRFEAWYNTRNTLGNTPEEELDRALGDYGYSGNGYLQVVQMGPATTFYHQSAWDTRLKKPDPDGVVRACYISQNFMSRTAYQINPPDMVELPLYPNPPKDMGNGTKVSVLHIKDYEDGFPHYGLPSCFSALPDAWVEYRCNAAWQNLMDTGFLSPTILQFIDEEVARDATGKKAEEFLTGIFDSFTGDGNIGKMMGQVLASEKDFVKATSIPVNLPKEFIQLKDQSRLSVIQAHQIPPELLIDPQNNSLGGITKNQRKNAFDQYMSTMIMPIQQRWAKELNEVMYDSLGVEFQFEEFDPFSQKLLTVNEVRESQDLPPLNTPQGNQIWQESN